MEIVGQVTLAVVLIAAGHLGYRRVSSQDRSWDRLVQGYATRFSDLLERIEAAELREAQCRSDLDALQREVARLKKRLGT